MEEYQKSILCKQYQTSKIYTRKDLAEVIPVTTRCITNYIRKGLLKGYKVCGMWVFTQEQVNDYLQNRN